MELAVTAISSNVADQGGRLRILTGLADGTDALAGQVATRLKLPLQIAAPYPTESSAALRAQAECQCYVSGSGAEPAPENWIAATDEWKVSLADVILVVWDGQAARGTRGGTVRILKESLQRHTPIIWIDPREATEPVVRLLDLSRLTASALAVIEASETRTDPICDLFSPPVKDLTPGLGDLLAACWDNTELARLSKFMERRNIDPRDRRVLAGSLHSNLFWLLGAWKRRGLARIPVWRGPDAFVDNSRLPEESWQGFDRLDRVATYAALKYRDLIVVVHLLGSLAVLGAVAGTLGWSLGWGAAELTVLLAILAILWRDRQVFSQHAVWLHYRQAAEALRISALLHPHLASLPQLQRRIWRASGPSDPHTHHLEKPCHWHVVQTLREAGLSLGHGGTPFILVEERQHRQAQLVSLLDDQILFHSGSETRNRTINHRLHHVTLAVFATVFVAVILHILAIGIEHLETAGVSAPHWLEGAGHWIHAQDWLLLVTAFLPALVAALHGIRSTLEFERVAENSRKVGSKLASIKRLLEDTMNDDNQDPLTLRALTILTAETMYREHDAWAELMETRVLEIPG
jgi:hypothetical protein